MLYCLVSSQSISAWKVSQRQGSIQYHQPLGAIVVAKPGLYFIYSQMYYHDKTTPIMGHYTCINNIKVLESIGSVINDSHRRYSTKYHGGMFRLKQNDRIQIRVPFTHKQYFMDATTSYLGTYRISS
jgi:hypothetical protein